MKFPPLKPESTDFLRLDLLRFLASCGIVWHHSHLYFHPESARQALAARTAGLAIFVDMFFVISGFIITVVYADRVGSISGILRFMQRRVGRLVPLHWVTLALTWIFWSFVVRLGFQADHLPELAGHCVAQTAALLNGFIKCGNGIVLNDVTWSISVEMALYLLFPLFALSLNRPRLLFALTVSAMILAIVWRYSSDDSWIQPPVPILRGVPAFLLGMVLARYRGTLAGLKLGTAPMILTLLATTAFMTNGASPLLTLVTAYCVVALAVAADAHAPPGLMVSRLAPLGQLTYGIYIWHLLFVTVLMNAIADKWLKLGTLPMLGVAMVCYASVLVVSYASWRWLETPARKYIDSLGRAPAPATRRPH